MEMEYKKRLDATSIETIEHWFGQERDVETADDRHEMENTQTIPDADKAYCELYFTEAPRGIPCTYQNEFNMEIEAACRLVCLTHALALTIATVYYKKRRTRNNTSQMHVMFILSDSASLRYLRFRRFVGLLFHRVRHVCCRHRQR